MQCMKATLRKQLRNCFLFSMKALGGALQKMDVSGVEFTRERNGLCQVQQYFQELTSDW